MSKLRYVKFMNSQYVDSFVSGSKIRIGTLHDFQDTERHMINVGDDLEGKTNYKFNKFVIDGTEKNFEENYKHIEKMKNLGITIEKGAKVNIFGSKISLVHQDCYIFSCSIFDDSDNSDVFKKIFNKFNKENNYDCCCEILDINYFIFSALKNIGYGNTNQKYRACQVTYNSKEFLFDDVESISSPDPFCKSKEYKWQKEFRIAIIPDKSFYNNFNKLNEVYIDISAHSVPIKIIKNI